jgi:diketogulonate reductase-like aldo/keto reductase
VQFAHRTHIRIPIIGARKLAQLEDNIRSLDVNLSSEQLQRLDQATAVSLGFPHDILALEPVKAIIYGDLRNRIKA